MQPCAISIVYIDDPAKVNEVTDAVVDVTRKHFGYTCSDTFQANKGESSEDFLARVIKYITGER